MKCAFSPTTSVNAFCEYIGLVLGAKWQPTEVGDQGNLAICMHGMD
jgi:hypothetical protein